MREAARILESIASVTAREARLVSLFDGGGEGDPESGDKVAALLDAVRVLEQTGSPYALIGGVAVGIHARTPRATLGVDLAVRTTSDRSTLAGAFQAAGFRLTGEFPHTVNLRHASGEPVQLSFDPAQDDAIDRALAFAVGTASVRIVTRDDLLRMKERAASDPALRRSKALRDRADVALLRGDVGDPDEGW